MPIKFWKGSHKVPNVFLVAFSFGEGGWDFSFLDVFQWASKGFPWSSQKVHWVLNVFIINSFPIAPHFYPKWGLAQSCQFFHPCKWAKGGGALYFYIENILFNFEKPRKFKYFLGDGPIKMTHCKKTKNLRSAPSN